VPRVLVPVAIVAAALLLPRPAAGQLVLGQYEDEAPLGTWNVFGLPSAASLGLGGAQFARASDPSVSLVNPALLLSLPRYAATLAGSSTWASMFKYSLVNTGVVSTPGDLVGRALGLDFGGVSLRVGRWAVAASSGILEYYGRPGIIARDASGTDTIDMAQTGYLRDIHVAAAGRIGGRLSAGLGLNVVTGQLGRQVVETMSGSTGEITISDDKEERFRGVYLNGGVAWEVTGRLTAAAVFRTPYMKKSRAQSHLRYQAPAGGTDIETDAAAVNEYEQPWVLGLGAAYHFSATWTVAADAAFFGWSRYSVTFFGEPLARDFRNVVRAAAGAEYLLAARVFGRPTLIPLRLGVSYDPQPMRAPHSVYFWAHAGAGLRFASLAVDLSAGAGCESGSGNGLWAGRLAVSVTYYWDR